MLRSEIEKRRESFRAGMRKSRRIASASGFLEIARCKVSRDDASTICAPGILRPTASFRAARKRGWSSAMINVGCVMALLPPTNFSVVLGQGIFHFSRISTARFPASGTVEQSADRALGGLQLRSPPCQIPSSRCLVAAQDTSAEWVTQLLRSAGEGAVGRFMDLGVLDRLTKFGIEQKYPELSEQRPTCRQVPFQAPRRRKLVRRAAATAKSARHYRSRASQRAGPDHRPSGDRQLLPLFCSTAWVNRRSSRSTARPAFPIIR